MREERPELITISVPGFASNDAERRELRAYESIVAASSGVFTDMGLNRVLMGLNPSFSPLPLASAYASQISASATVLALQSRQVTGLGEGGQGLGPKRVSGTGADKIVKRVPRNAPALWNLGAKSISVLMHDGRINADPIYGNGFNTPAEEWLPDGLASVLSAQALFPMTSSVEMARNVGENEVIGATRDRIDAAWPIIAKRVRTIPAYGDGFVAAFDDVGTSENVTITHIADALAQFMVQDFTSFDSPFDAYLA